MSNIPVYTQYNDETKIALMDNSTVAFLEQMDRCGIDMKGFLKEYDILFIPRWVMEEIDDSIYRSKYIESLREDGLPVYVIEEESYAELANGEESNLYKIVLAVVSTLGMLRSYMRRYVEKEDVLDMEEYSEWIARLYHDWPLLGTVKGNGRVQKKNAGEISLIILAEVISWYFSGAKIITVYTQDRDAYDYQQNAHEALRNYFQDRMPAEISFKSNDALICQMYRQSVLRIEDIKNIRKDLRIVIFTRQKADESTVLAKQKFDNKQFVELIQDKNVQIIF